jgi:formylglycine-generating enzyme required for sulfatase activity
MVRVKGGTFIMGSPASEPERSDDEGPQHRVTVSPFYMGKYQVTQAEYKAVIGTNPSKFKGNNLPVEMVSWYDAVEYCNRLSLREGLSPAYTVNGTDVTWNRSADGYRLPTEAEWEYAAKGGDGSPGNYTYSGSNNPDDVAWYQNNSGERTHEVGGKAPNGLGLYDMSGNVEEWCWDLYGNYSSNEQTNPIGAVSGASRVIRGGSWDGYGQVLRSASRNCNTPSYWSDSIGFRLVRP